MGRKTTDQIRTEPIPRHRWKSESGGHQCTCHGIFITDAELVKARGKTTISISFILNWLAKQKEEV